MKTWTYAVCAGGVLSIGAAAMVVCGGASPERAPLLAAASDAPAAERPRGVVMPPELGEGLAEYVAACYDPDSPPSDEFMAQMEAWFAAQVGGFGPRYNIGARWSGSQGSPRALTWSLVPDGLSIPSGVGEPTANSELFSRMDTLFAANGGRATWIQQMENVFARWQALAGLTYTRISGGSPNADADDGAAWGTAGQAGLRGDVRISMKNIDGGGGILAYNAFPSSGDMVLDRSESWGGSTNTFRFFRNVFAHEHGHGIGIFHVCPANRTKLMEPFIFTNQDGPQQDDIRAAQRHYGDPYEPDNTPAEANPLGTLDVGNNFLIGAIPNVVGTVTYPAIPNATNTSIDANGEIDYWGFTTGRSVLATVDLVPIGSIYNDNTQDDACSQGPQIDSRAMANLAVRIFDSNGTTSIAIADDAALGASEQVAGIVLEGGKQYYVAAYETDTPTETQLYRMTIVATTATFVTATDAAFSNRVDLSWSSLANSTQFEVLRGSTSNIASASVIATLPAGTSAYSDLAVAPGTTYFYWVRVSQSFGGATGAARLLNTTAEQGSTSGAVAPGAFSLIAPAGGATGVATGPLFDWSDSSGATTYALTVDDNADFSSPVISQNVASSQYQAGANTLANSTTFFWRVVASNGGGNTASTPESASFTTIVAAPGAFSLVSPADGATGVATGPLFDWSDSVGVAQYTLQVDDNADFSSPALSQVTGSSQFQASPGALANDTAYFWRVIASNAGGDTISATRTFTTIVAPPGAFDLISPANGSTELGLEPVLDWSDSAGAASYTLTIDDNGDFSSPVLSIGVPVSGYTVLAGALQGGTEYFWNVTATNAGGTADSSVFSFTTRIDVPAPFSLVSPTNGATGVEDGPVFDWADSARAESYQLTVDDNADFSSPIISETLASSEFDAAAGTLPGGVTIYWKVVATNVTGSTDSVPAVAEFQTAAAPCEADFNGDGFVDFFDFDDYVSCFEGIACPPGKDADFNGDGFTDFFDFDDFTAAFEAGC